MLRHAVRRVYERSGLRRAASATKRALVSLSRLRLSSEVEALKDRLAALQVECAIQDALGNGAGDRESADPPPPDRHSLQTLLVERLQSRGVPVRPDEPVYLHVGFGHSGTTSLQQNFFSRRNDLHYFGTPYPDAGGFFSSLKYVESTLLSEEEMVDWCRNVIYGGPRRRGRPIVVSDESLCDTTEVYYCPRHLPSDMVAARLKRFFPTAKIIFTIRHQPDYISSMYFNLKRNYAFLAGTPMPSFGNWWTGMQTQVRCLYLQNLDYSYLIDVYARLFGQENIFILPLEILKDHGPQRYLVSLCAFMGLECSDADLFDFSLPRNERMSVVENRLAKLVSAGSGELPAVQAVLEKESLKELIEKSPKVTLTFDDEQLEAIRRRVTPGNRRIKKDYGVPLGDLGYFV
jgi:hypothetical protein